MSSDYTRFDGMSRTKRQCGCIDIQVWNEGSMGIYGLKNVQERCTMHGGEHPYIPPLEDSVAGAEARLKDAEARLKDAQAAMIRAQVELLKR